MPNKTNPWPAIRLASFLLAVVIVLVVVINQWPCSNSYLTKITLDLELLRSEQESNQAMLYLVDSIFEWEEMADDFSMHDDWVARKIRANTKLIELGGLIPDLQNQLNECNHEGN